MSTQFFERQDNARSNTIYLVVLFAIAVAGLVVTNSTIAYLATDYFLNPTGILDSSRQDDSPSPSTIAGAVGVATLLVIGAGTLYQIMALRMGGGSSVAESLGGRQLMGETKDLNERKVLNIVEEMAIASGIPVPPVFLMEETGINAFAAGYMPGDAVVGVTRGAVENLTREELQGVIAHEFSHILNGDMRMNIRMIGVLHGILLLGLIGQTILRSAHYSSLGTSRNRDKNDGFPVILLIGVTLVVVGWIGSFIGGLIKAAVSRQREYLADASAVQFTRNASGIAGALKRIAAFSTQGRLAHPNASVASHMYFAQGVFEGLSGLLATHPPLPSRIKALDPMWDGTLLPPSGSPSAFPMGSNSAPLGSSAVAPQQNSYSGAGATGLPGMSNFAPSNPSGNSTPPLPGLSNTPDRVPVPTVMAASEQIGAPEMAHRHYAAELLRRIDPVLLDAARDPYSARVLVMVLLISDDLDIRAKQFVALDRTLKADVVELVRRLIPKAVQVPEVAKLPLIDLALPMLRRMSVSQYKEFATAFSDLCHADSEISIFEWTLAQIIQRNLRRQYLPGQSTATKYFRLQGLENELSLLFSILAQVGNEDGDVAKAFGAATTRFEGLALKFVPTDGNSLDLLETVLNKLALSHPRRRGEIVDACAAIVCSDRLVRVREAELLRGISDLLDCPMPPLVGELELTSR